MTTIGNIGIDPNRIQLTDLPPQNSAQVWPLT